MTALRMVLLALALVMFGTFAVRLTGGLDRRATTRVASAPESAPASPPAPSAPATASPATASPATASPATASPPRAPQAPAPAATGLTATAARQGIEAALQAAPDLAHVFDAMRAQFPADAERSLAAAAAAAQASGTLPSADDFIAGAMRDLRLSAGVLAARAGPEQLNAIFEAKAATLADLEAADPRICADFIFGGTSPEFADFQVAHRGLVARASLAAVAAMADGRERQVHRDPPSSDDYKWLEAALTAKGLSGDEIAALLDGKSLDPPPSDTRLCDNARSYLDAMRSMPDDARNRVYGLAAELLARS